MRIKRKDTMIYLNQLKKNKFKVKKKTKSQSITTPMTMKKKTYKKRVNLK